MSRHGLILVITVMFVSLSHSLRSHTGMCSYTYKASADIALVESAFVNQTEREDHLLSQQCSNCKFSYVEMTGDILTAEHYPF